MLFRFTYGLMLTARSRGEELHTIYHLPSSSSFLSESVIMFDSEFEFEVFGIFGSLCGRGGNNFQTNKLQGNRGGSSFGTNTLQENGGGTLALYQDNYRDSVPGTSYDSFLLFLVFSVLGRPRNCTSYFFSLQCFLLIIIIEINAFS